MPHWVTLPLCLCSWPPLVDAHKRHHSAPCMRHQATSLLPYFTAHVLKSTVSHNKASSALVVHKCNHMNKLLYIQLKETQHIGSPSCKEAKKGAQTSNVSVQPTMWLSRHSCVGVQQSITSWLEGVQAGNWAPSHHQAVPGSTCPPGLLIPASGAGWPASACLQLQLRLMVRKASKVLQDLLCRDLHRYKHALQLQPTSQRRFAALHA